MFSLSILASVLLLASMAIQTHAHAMPSPALGVVGRAVTRNDVQRPSTQTPCGSIDIASNIDKSTAVPVEEDGSVMLNVTNFNPGADGSRKVSVLVDPTGTGKNFVAANVTTNGDPAPKTDGSDQVKISLPEGMKCTGGKAGDLCLLSVKSTAGFGACSVVSQTSSTSTSTSTSDSGSGSDSSSESSAAAPAATKSAAASASTSTREPCNGKRQRRAVGTRAPRAMRRGLHENPVFAA